MDTKTTAAAARFATLSTMSTSGYKAPRQFTAELVRETKTTLVFKVGNGQVKIFKSIDRDNANPRLARFAFISWT